MIPEVDATGRSFAVLAFGAVAHSVADCWARRIEMADARLWAWHGEHADREALRALRTELNRARVGWRLMVAGPDADVRPAVAEAEAHGAVPEEIRTYLTPGPIRVYCPACTTTTTSNPNTASRGAGTKVECEGCGRELVIRDHFSARLGAWLGEGHT